MKGFAFWEFKGVFGNEKQGDYKMVDFNQEGTVATAPSDLLKMLILEKRDSVIMAIVRYNKAKSNGVASYSNEVVSTLVGLWYELKAMLLGSADKKEKVHCFNLEDKTKQGEVIIITLDLISKIEKDLLNSKYEDLISIFNFLNDYLYMKGITKIDLRKNYDSSRASAVNKAKGL